ncbi:hypothetical protein GCM10009616_03580 [Microlunatus lacustris]
MVFVRLAFFPGGTAAHYAELQRVVDVTTPPERHYFAAGPVDGGWQVVQAWRSREDLDAFNAAVLEPAYAALGGRAFPLPPAVTDFEAVQVAPPPPH